MKKVYIVLTLLILILTACNAAPTSTQETVLAQEATLAAQIVSGTQTALASNSVPTTTPAGSAALTTDYENAAPVSIQLLVGVTQLENTDQAITSTQAQSFLAVLTSLKELTTNTSATQEQFDALVEQAEAILTTEQISAIAKMQITQDTAMSLMQKLGSGMDTPPQGQGNGNPPAQGATPQGTPPAGGPSGQPPSGDQMGTPPAAGNQPTMGLLPPQLIDILIQLMQNKTTAS